MLFYNKNLLSSAPLSTTEMISVAKNLTGGGQYGLVYNLNEPFWLIPWLTGFRGWVLDESGHPITPTLNTPAMVNTLQFVHDLRWVHGVVPSGTVDYNRADQLFWNGNAAMIVNGDWALGQYRAHFGANLGVARIPLVADTGQWPRPMTSGKYYMINSNSRGEALAASKLFLHYATSKQAQLLWPQNASVLPALLQAFNDPIVQMNPILQGSAAQASVGRLMPTVAEMRCVWEAMGTPIAAIMDDQITPAEAAAAMQTDAAACVGEIHRRYYIYLPLIMHNR
jgi:arabinogalactan oligomer/maltooligosaccharide transport system substrate-binding protein